MASILKTIERHKEWAIAGVVVLGLWLYTKHSFGFADKSSSSSSSDKKKSSPHTPSDSDIDKLIKQHHIGDPNKDIYDVQYPSSGKHKGDIEITDLGPYSTTPTKTTTTHHKHPQGSIYPSIGPTNADCCAQLQMLMSQGGGPPQAMYAYDDEGWGFDDW